MNPLLQAAAQTLADVVQDHAAITAPAATEGGGAFTLPNMAHNGVAERIHGAKVTQQQASTAQRQQDNDPAAMQALMALFLAQPVHALPPSGGAMPPPDGERLKKLAAQSGNSASPLLRQLADAMAQNGKSAMPQTGTGASSLSPQMQALLSKLTQETSQMPATPEQQATLAHFSAQDLRAIAPEQPALSTSQRLAGRAKQEQNHDAIPRAVAVKKQDNVGVKAPAMAPNLLNVAAQTPAPVGHVNDKTLIAAHNVNPAEMSSDELGEKLTVLLKERIHFQLGQQQQVSTIRLDPPSLGKLEIAIQLDAGKLTVHIGANQSDVCRSLQQFSEDLRQHLTAQNFMEVNVQVSSEGQSQQQQQQSGHQQEEVKSALSLEDEPQRHQHDAVLIKV
ncbi:flagellar hook-length control protein FliK [Citrobacter amalonaticus]|uniref:flagellar hook-length control protein FliK n=1 Tax=Citrobacter amalonaticus TaxID=35703 RepID=UPI001908106E|nr:flagellar hook-length control protein FliK [Citrobacter amalonaticus]MBJ9329354.1 flagellar hook-length control protein FliK [Citrobacter amalonaticus]